jgi:hypothetical protein
MIMNFIQVGGTYKSKNGYDWECIGVKGDRAWLVLNGDYDRVAYVCKLDGTAISHAGVEAYELLPPKPEIAQNDANLWYSTLNGWALLDLHETSGTNGTLYTHSKAKVALFVPLNINGETLAEAFGELQEEIGQ